MELLRSLAEIDPRSLLESVSTRFLKRTMLRTYKLEELRVSFWSVEVSNLDCKINFIYKNIFEKC